MFEYTCRASGGLRTGRTGSYLHPSSRSTQKSQIFLINPLSRFRGILDASTQSGYDRVQHHMAKTEPQLDVLVLGEHPSAYLAAALIAGNSKLRVLHTTIPDDSQPDRLVVINPEFFKLHPLLEPLRRKLEMVATYGLGFLSHDAAIRSEYRNKSISAYIASYKAVRAAMIKVAEANGVELVTPKVLQIHRLDEHGAEVTVGKGMVRPKVLVLGGLLPEPQQKLLGLPEAWGVDIVHRYTFIKLPGTKWANLGSRPIIPMCLNLNEMLCWGWLLQGPKGIQISVEQPVETLSKLRPGDLLSAWIEVLRQNGVLLHKLRCPSNQPSIWSFPWPGRWRMREWRIVRF